MTGAEIAVAGLILGAASTTYSVVEGQKQKKAAKRQAAAQQRQAELNRLMENAKRRRTARAKRAQAIARGGAAGVGGSISEGTEAAFETSISSQEALNLETTRLQQQQIGFDLSQTTSAINANISQAVASFAGEALDFRKGQLESKTELVTPEVPDIN